MKKELNCLELKAKLFALFIFIKLFEPFFVFVFILNSRQVNNLKLTNYLLLIIAVPILVLVLKTLKFIFVPLVFAMFITLLFIPLIRRMKKNGIHKLIRAFTSLTIIVSIGVIIFQLLNLSSREIRESKDLFIARAEVKMDNIQNELVRNFGIDLFSTNDKRNEIKTELIFDNAQKISGILLSIFPQLLTTLFFVVLLLFEVYDFEKLMHKTILKKRHSSIKTFKRIEKDIVKFLAVKFLISAGTGIGTGLVCYMFDVSFPIFWGIFAFTINFVQMIGSIVAIVLCSIFGFVEMETGYSLFYFILSITGIQIIFGSILEPIFMGKSFTLNIIVVLIMLMFWGYVWGVAGMILCIPLTVFIKIILEQFDKTKKIAFLME